MSNKKEGIGSFFHIFNQEGIVEKQGQIIKRTSNNQSIVRFFSWTDGSRSQKTDTIELPKTTKFYSTAKEMRLAWIELLRENKSGLYFRNDQERERQADFLLRLENKVL